MHCCVLCNYLALSCNNPHWDIHRGHTVIGASSPVLQPSVQACLDYCVLWASCWGVDVDINTNPIRCWPHTNADDYVDSNYYSQAGTDSYRLVERCAPTTVQQTTTTPLPTTTPVLGGNSLSMQKKLLSLQHSVRTT